MERCRPGNAKEAKGGIRKIGQRNEYLKSFTVNGIEWTLVPVEPDNTQLLDELGNYRLAVTDFPEKKVYYSKKRSMDSNSHKTLKRSGKRKSNINEAIGRDYDIRVLIHEICHCVLYSYGLLYDIRKAVEKDYWILAEEWICNFLYDYGLEAQQIGIDMLDENSQT